MSNTSSWYLSYKYWGKTKLSNFKGEPIEETFKEIYEKIIWKSSDSISGTGADELQTETLVRELPKLFEEYQISTLHDIPCGDFNWMSKVNLTDVDYMGSDIVPEITDKNNHDYTSESIKFETLDLTVDSLPEADLIFTRDCLVHL